MARYYLQFSKEGYAVYTSHLDMQRFFKRAFARAGVGLAFSNGFNPHPKMSFAQPLSLGYSSCGEYLEFQTADQWQDTAIKDRLQAVMPEGISILTVRQLPEQGKSLASMCTAASYKIFLRWDPQEMGCKAKDFPMRGFLDQEQILVLKRMKKKKEPKEVDIKGKIREIEWAAQDNIIIMSTILDAGSDSNLSPDLLIQAIGRYVGHVIPPDNVEITRMKIHLDGLDS